jgi:lipoprotein-anchoring transpeptidase ErfK/SrfK
VSSAIAATLVVLPAEAAKKKKRYKAAPAAVHVMVDVSSQSMSVRVNGSHYANWRVSTAKSGYYTPRGSYGVQRMHREYYSRKYDNAPMPHSIFFRGPYAIHGTYQTGKLGRPASRGCVRLAPGNAAKLFALVQRYGRARIMITN